MDEKLCEIGKIIKELEEKNVSLSKKMSEDLENGQPD